MNVGIKAVASGMLQAYPTSIDFNDLKDLNIPKNGQQSLDEISHSCVVVHTLSN